MHTIGVGVNSTQLLDVTGKQSAEQQLGQHRARLHSTLQWSSSPVVPTPNSMADGPNLDHMRRAIELARVAGLEAKTGRPFGSVVVDAGGQIVGEGCNQVVAQKDPTWHAEMQAIREACKRLGTTSLAGCTVYASSQPCPMCTGAIYWSGISRCYYGAGIDDLVKHGVYTSAKDTFFDREDKLDPPQRTQLPFVQVLREEAASVHEEYGKLGIGQKATY